MEPISASPGSSWIPIRFLLELSWREFSRLFRAWCCLLLITGLHMLVRFQLLWPRQTWCLFVRTLPSSLCLNFTKVPTRSWLIKANSLLFRWDPGRTQFLLIVSSLFSTLIWFLSSLQVEVDLLARVWFPALFLLLPSDGILHAILCEKYSNFDNQHRFFNIISLSIFRNGSTAKTT